MRSAYAGGGALLPGIREITEHYRVLPRSPALPLPDQLIPFLRGELSGAEGSPGSLFGGHMTESVPKTVFKSRCPPLHPSTRALVITLVSARTGSGSKERRRAHTRGHELPCRKLAYFGEGQELPPLHIPCTQMQRTWARGAGPAQESGSASIRAPDVSPTLASRTI